MADLGLMLYRWTAAHVRMHTRDSAGVASWTAEQVDDAFALLPPPAIPFEIWMDAKGESLQEINDQAKREHNGKMLRSMGVTSGQ